MSRCVSIALTNPVEGKEQEFNEWYDNQHVPDVLALPGCVSAQRFKLTGVQMPNRPCPFQYLAIYEFETDDLEAAVAATVERRGTAAMRGSDAVNWDVVLNMIYEPLGPKTEKKP